VRGVGLHIGTTAHITGTSFRLYFLHTGIRHMVTTV